MSQIQASAGRVLLISKGTWAANTAYGPMDYVYYSGSTYVCKLSVNSTTTPDLDTTHWQIFAAGFDPAAITALSNKIGDLSDLDTTDKASVVNAINELVSDINDVDTKTSKCEVLVIDVASFNSLPQTVTDDDIESDMVVINSVLGTPYAQTDGWTVTTSAGSLTIAGTISGSTTLTLYLAKSR